MATFIKLTRSAMRASNHQAPSPILVMRSWNISGRTARRLFGSRAMWSLARPTISTSLAPDIETATKVATIIRTFGHATTEVWAATEWEKFTGLLRSLPPRLVAS